MEKDQKKNKSRDSGDSLAYDRVTLPGQQWRETDSGRRNSKPLPPSL